MSDRKAKDNMSTSEARYFVGFNLTQRATTRPFEIIIRTITTDNSLVI